MEEWGQNSHHRVLSFDLYNMLSYWEVILSLNPADYRYTMPRCELRFMCVKQYLDFPKHTESDEIVFGLPPQKVACPYSNKKEEVGKLKKARIMQTIMRA